MFPWLCGARWWLKQTGFLRATQTQWDKRITRCVQEEGVETVVTLSCCKGVLSNAKVHICQSQTQNVLFNADFCPFLWSLLEFCQPNTVERQWEIRKKISWNEYIFPWFGSGSQIICQWNKFFALKCEKHILFLLNNFNSLIWRTTSYVFSL